MKRLFQGIKLNNIRLFLLFCLLVIVVPNSAVGHSNSKDIDTTVTKTVTGFIWAAEPLSVKITANRTKLCKTKPNDTTQLYAMAQGCIGPLWYSFTWGSSQKDFSSYDSVAIITPTQDTTTYWCTVSYAVGLSVSDTITIYLEDFTGLVEREAVTGKLTIIPNPNSGAFIIKSEKEMRKIEILNQFGSVVFQKAMCGQKETLNLPIDIGIYFVKITVITQNNKEVTAVRKLIIE